MMSCRIMRSAVMTLTPMLCATASSVISPRSAHSSSRWTEMPWGLRNEQTRVLVQPLPRPVGLPARLRSRAICWSGIRRANSRVSDNVYQLELNLTVVVGFRSEAGGGARFSPGVGTATRPPGGTEITTYDPGPEDYPSEGWAARTGQTARQC